MKGSKQKETKLSSFPKMAQKHGLVPILLKVPLYLTRLHSERPKSYTILAFLSAVGLR